MLHIFIGEDTFSRREALQQLKSDLDQDGMLATNTSFLEAAQTTPEEVASACLATPFFGSSRLVILEGLLQSAGQPGRRSSKRSAAKQPAAEKATGGDSTDVGSGYEGPWRALLAAIDQMPETTTLVLIDDKASEVGLLKALRGMGNVERFDPLRQGTVAGWIQRRARDRGLKLDAAAISLIADAVGPNSWMLANELDKLQIYARGEVIREADARELVSRVRERQAYLLADAIAEGREQQALKLLHELVATGDAVQLLLSTIEGRYRRMAVAREMLDARMSDSKIGQQLRMSGYGLERIIEQAARWSPEMLRAAMARIAQADVDIKDGTYEDVLSLELLVHDLSDTRGARAA